MQDFLRWLAGWKGVSLEEGAELQFELSRFPTGGMALLVILGVLLVLLLTAFIYRRDGHNLTGWQRLVLGSLRAIALLAAVLLLLEPNLVAVKKETRPGHTILLVDVSQSMNHVDAFRREGVQALAQGWRDAGVGDPATARRIDLARAALALRDGELVQKLGARNQVQVYGFATGLGDLPVVAPPAPPGGPGNGEGGTQTPAAAQGPPPPPRLDLAALQADGRASNLGGALRAALDKSRSSEVAAVVILSDGRRNVGPQGAELARLLNQRKVPHTFVLGIGDPSETQTVEVLRVDAPEKVFQRDPFELSAQIGSQGYDNLSVNVRLLRTDEKGADAQVTSRTVSLGGDQPEARVEFKDLTSEETGRFVYRVEIEPPGGEPPAPERHRKETPIEVLGEKTRVLLLAGCANHEFQVLRNLLIRDKTIDVSCWLQSADPGFPQDGDVDVRIEKLPEDRKELDAYDAVILMDPDQSKLLPTFCDLLRRQCLENGCGIWWVAGEKYSLDAMRPMASTRPLAELLPVVPDMDKADQVFIGFGRAWTTPWTWQITPEGSDGIAAKVTRITENRDESALLWARLPGYYFWFPVLRPKPAASVMIEHPSPDLGRDGRLMPVVATHLVGAGRVLWSGTDETYRWRSIHEDAYNRFWVKGIRYLFEGRINAGNSRFRLLAAGEKIELGEALRLSVEARDDGMQPLIAEAVELAVERDNQSLETVRLLPVQEVPGAYELQYRPTQTGVYRIRSLPQVGRSVEVGFQVVPAQIEREGPMDRAELAAIAACNGGQLCDTPAQLLAALDQVPSRNATDTFRTPHALWDGWATVLFIVVVLALEWLLRKRFNLL